MTGPKLTLDELPAEIEAGSIDTVMVAFTDIQGRLQGERLHGYAMTSWEKGYGDFLFELDMSTLRRMEEALQLLLGSTVARAAFGDDVVEHYAHAAEVEVAAYSAAVTDWERKRGFERL